MKTRKYKYIIITGFLSMLLVIALVAVFTGFTKKQSEKNSALPYYNTADFTPEWNSNESEKHTIADFTFTDQNGNSFGSRDLTGKIYAVDFFFTTCPGICPTLTKNLTKVQEAYKHDSSLILV